MKSQSSRLYTRSDVISKGNALTRWSVRPRVGLDQDGTLPRCNDLSQQRKASDVTCLLGMRRPTGGIEEPLNFYGLRSLRRSLRQPSQGWHSPRGQHQVGPIQTSDYCVSFPSVSDLAGYHGWITNTITVVSLACHKNTLSVPIPSISDPGYFTCFLGARGNTIKPVLISQDGEPYTAA